MSAVTTPIDSIPMVSTQLQERVARVEALLGQAALDYVPSTLASSLGAEDMVLADAILRARLPIEIFTLDTGRLHAETLALVDRVQERYGYAIKLYRPDEKAVAGYVNEFGLDAIYDSIELRTRCCQIRKVEPLKRALAGKTAWITGLRRAQAVTRSNVQELEFDPTQQLWKFNPLADWSEEDVWEYVRAFDVPYNPLHDKGFRSIGCEPCTRAIGRDDDLRAGRWWWEDPERKECGLHPRTGKPLKPQERNVP